MADPYIAEKSFIARLNVANTRIPAPVALWESSPGYHGSTVWHSSEWLTTTRQDAKPMEFWFGAVEWSEGEYVYEIRLWTGDKSHALYNRRVEISRNGYLGLYELNPIVGPLWRLDFPSDSQVRIATLENEGVGITWDVAVWTTGRRGSYLQVDNKRSVLFNIEVVQQGVDEPL